jgi:hypothetical protein
MLDLTKYTETQKTVTFANGKTLKVYSKETKNGVRFFYYSFSCGSGRMLPVSKNDIK